MSHLALDLRLVDATLASYVTARRWFRGKARKVEGCSLEHAIPLPLDGPIEGARAWIGIARVAYADGKTEDYVLPLLAVGAGRAAEIRRTQPELLVADEPSGGAIIDALGDENVLRSILKHIDEGTVLAQDASEVRFQRLTSDHLDVSAAPHPIRAEQSNTSVVLGEAYVLKAIRRFEEGTGADLEMGAFLTEARFANAPAVVGAIAFSRQGREPGTLAIVHRFVPNRGDAWAFFLKRLARRLEGAPREDAADPLGEDRARLQLLAQRIAEMHVALASRADLPAFAPEPLVKEDRARLADAVRISLHAAFASLASRAGALPADAAHRVAALRNKESALDARLAAFVDADLASSKTRVHGDLHLGQILVTDDDFMLIDFEGEPARPLAERGLKRSPLADVAGVLRSLHYATVSAARNHPVSGPEKERTMAEWHREARATFLNAYLAGAAKAHFLPQREADTRLLLDFFVLEKCVYEVHYEMNNRPDWVAIPLAGLAELVEGPESA